MPDPAHPEDLALARRCAAGDAAAIEALLGRFGALILDAARQVLGGREADAEDAASETLLRLLGPSGALAGYRGEAALSTYLYGVARRVALGMARSRRRNRSLSEEVLAQVSDDREETPGDPAWLALAMGRLPERERRALDLRYREGLSFAELSRRLSVPAGTAAAWVARGRERLRALWKHENLKGEA